MEGQVHAPVPSAACRDHWVGAHAGACLPGQISLRGEAPSPCLAPREVWGRGGATCPLRSSRACPSPLSAPLCRGSYWGPVWGQDWVPRHLPPWAFHLGTNRGPVDTAPGVAGAKPGGPHTSCFRAGCDPLGYIQMRTLGLWSPLDGRGRGRMRTWAARGGQEPGRALTSPGGSQRREEPEGPVGTQWSPAPPATFAHPLTPSTGHEPGARS